MPQSSIASWLRGSVSSPPTATEHESKQEHAKPAEGSDTFKIALSPTEAQSITPTPPRRTLSASQNADLSSLPPNVSLEMCTPANINAFRRLTSLLLPIQYPDSFYKETLENEVIASITRVATWTATEDLRADNTIVKSLPSGLDDEAKVVGGIRCRLLACPPHKPTVTRPTLYISTIGVLAPFRELSLGSHLLQVIVDAAVQEYRVSEVYAHVWEANEVALEWYNKRGFTVLQKEYGYYRRLAPKTDAWLIKKDIG